MNNKFWTASLASLYFIYYTFTYKEWHFIDNLNLIIHEAGHVVFAFFGTTLHILGGSLFQVLLPIVFVLYFLLRREYFSASLVLFWVGQNLLNVSVYASDAVSMSLPLLGGDAVNHDWNTLLGMWGLLNYTNAIGTVLFVSGVIVIVSSIYFSIIYSWESHYGNLNTS